MTFDMWTLYVAFPIGAPIVWRAVKGSQVGPHAVQRHDGTPILHDDGTEWLSTGWLHGLMIRHADQRRQQTARTGTAPAQTLPAHETEAIRQYVEAARRG